MLRKTTVVRYRTYPTRQQGPAPRRQAPPRPRCRLWPYYSRFPVGEGPLKDAVRDTRKPFLAFAGALGGSGLLGSLKLWDRIGPVLNQAGLSRWLESQAVLLFEVAILSILAFLLLTLLLIRLIDGWWMFSIARNMVVTAALGVVILLFRLGPEHLFAGSTLVTLLAALLISYVFSGFPKAYAKLRACGDLALEIALLAPFLALIGAACWTTPQVKLTWSALDHLWRRLAS